MSKRNKKSTSPASTAKVPVKGGSTAVRPTTRQILWARAAGRCQYRGCNCDLIGDLIAGKGNAQFGFVAHIVADAPAGPRGDAVRSPQLVDEVRNLMLLCHTHHKLIDVDDVAGHPEDFLLAMKAEHEARISAVVGVQQDRASHVLIYAANIGGQAAPITYSEAVAAMLPDRHPAENRAIEIQMIGSAFHDADRQFWDNEAENLRRHFATRVNDRVAARDISHLSVFALAPQPLLIELGRLLGDITDVDVRQLHREPKGWRWAEDGGPLQFDIRRPASTQGRPALVVGISATVTDERIIAAMGSDACIWSISVPGPHNDVMRCREDLRAFRRMLRSLLNEMKAAHGEAAEIAVFPAVPVSVAVEIGRVWMPKADLPMAIYDQDRATGGFTKALVIRQPTIDWGAAHFRHAS